MIIISNNTDSGFCPVVRNSQFICAFITPSPMYAPGKITDMKRHNDTDEVFVLLSGKAVLLTRDNINKECQATQLSPDTAYTVKAGTWHYLALSPDGKIFVTKSGSINPSNTDKADVSAENIIADIL